MKSRYTSQEVVALIKAERALVKTIYSDHGHDEHWDFLLDQLADPENVRPLSTLKDESPQNRRIIYDRYTGTLAPQRFIPDDHKRGEPKPGHENIKATAATLLPADGRMRLYNHSNTARAFENTAILFDTGTEIDPKKSIIKHCYREDSGTVTKFWIKGQDLLPYHHGRRPKAIPELPNQPAIETLRECNRAFTDNLDAGQSRHHYERNEVRIKPRSRDVFAVLALNSGGSQGGYHPKSKTTRDDRINALYRKVYTMQKLKTDESLPLEPGVAILEDDGVHEYPLLPQAGFEYSQVEDVLNAMAEDINEKKKNQITRKTHTQALIDLIEKCDVYKPDFWEIIEAYRLFLFSESCQHNPQNYQRFLTHYTDFIKSPEEVKRDEGHAYDREQRKRILKAEKEEQEKPIHENFTKLFQTNDLEFKNKQITEEAHHKRKKALTKEKFDLINPLRKSLNAVFLKDDQKREILYQAEKKARFIKRVFNDEKSISADRKAWSEIVTCIDQHNKKNIFNALKNTLQNEILKKTIKAPEAKQTIEIIDKHFQTPLAYPAYRPKPKIPASATATQKEAILKQYDLDLLQDHRKALSVNQFESGSHQSLLQKAEEHYAEPTIRNLIALGIPDPKTFYQTMLRYFQEQTAVTYTFKTREMFGTANFSVKILNVHESIKHQRSNYASERRNVEKEIFSILPKPYKETLEKRDTLKPRYASFQFVNGNTLPTPVASYGQSFAVFHPHALHNMLFVHCNAYNVGGKLEPSSFHHFEVLLKQFSLGQVKTLVNMIDPSLVVNANQIKSEPLQMEAYVPPINILDNQIISHIHIDAEDHVLNADEKALLKAKGIPFTNSKGYQMGSYWSINRELTIAIQTDKLVDFKNLLQAHPILPRLQKEPLILQAMSAGSPHIFEYLFKQKKQDPKAILPASAKGDWKKIVPAAKHAKFSSLLENPEDILRHYDEDHKITFSLALLNAIATNDFSTLESLLVCLKKLTSTQHKDLLDFSHPLLNPSLETKSDAYEWRLIQGTEYKNISLNGKLSVLKNTQWRAATFLGTQDNASRPGVNIGVHYDGESSASNEWIPYSEACTRVKWYKQSSPLMTKNEFDNMQVGDKILALDTQQHLLAASVVEKNHQQIKIHYEGWGARWDEWFDFKEALKRVELLQSSKPSITVTVTQNSSLEFACLSLSLHSQPDCLKILLENQFAKRDAIKQRVKKAIEDLPAKEKANYQEILKKFELTPEYLEAIEKFQSLVLKIKTLSVGNPSKQDQDEIQDNFKALIKIGLKQPDIIIEEKIENADNNRHYYSTFQFCIRYRIELPGIQALINIFEKAQISVPLFEEKENLFSLATTYYPEALSYLLNKLPHQAQDLKYALLSLMAFMHESQKLQLVKELLKQGKIPLSKNEAVQFMAKAIIDFPGSKEYALFQIYESDLTLDYLATLLTIFFQCHKDTEVKRLIDENPGILAKTLDPRTEETLFHRFLDSLPNRSDLTSKSPNFTYLPSLLNEKMLETKNSVARSPIKIATEKRDSLHLIFLMLNAPTIKFLTSNLIFAFEHVLDRLEEEKSWDTKLINAFLAYPDITLSETLNHSSTNSPVSIIERLIPSVNEFNRLKELTFLPTHFDAVLRQVLKLANPQTLDLRIQDFIKQIHPDKIQDCFNHYIDEGRYDLAEHLMAYAKINADYRSHQIMTGQTALAESFIDKLCQHSQKSVLGAILKEADSPLVLRRTQLYLKYAKHTSEVLAECMTKLHTARNKVPLLLLTELLTILDEMGGKNATNTQGFSQCLMDLREKFPTDDLSIIYHLFLKNPKMDLNQIQRVFVSLFQSHKPNQALLNLFISKGTHLDASLLDLLIKRIYQSQYTDSDYVFQTIEWILEKQKSPLDKGIKYRLMIDLSTMITQYDQHPTLLENFLALLQKTGLIKLIEKETVFIKQALQHSLQSLKLLRPLFKESDPGIATLLSQKFSLNIAARNFDEAKLIYSLRAEYGNFNLNEKNANGYTPLHSLTGKEHEPLFYQLVNDGADLSITNPDGKSAFLLWLNPKVKQLVNGSTDPLVTIAAYQKVWNDHFIQPASANALSFHIDDTKKAALYAILHQEISKQLNKLGENCFPHQGPSIPLDNPELLNALMKRDFTSVIAKFRQVELAPGIRFDNRQILANNPKFAEHLEEYKYFFNFNEKDKPELSFEQRVARFNYGNVEKEDNFQDMLLISSRLADLSPSEKDRFIAQVKFFIRAYFKSADLDLKDMKEEVDRAKLKNPDHSLEHKQRIILADQTGLYLMTQFLCTTLDNQHPLDTFFLDHRIQSMKNMKIISGLMTPPVLKIDTKQVQNIVKTYHQNKWHFFGHQSKPIAQSQQSHKLLKELQNNQISEQEKYHLVQKFVVSREASKTTLANVIKSELQIVTTQDAALAERLHKHSYKYRLRQWLKMPVISQESQNVLKNLEKASTHFEKYQIVLQYLYQHSDKRLAKIFEDINPLLKPKK